MTVKRSKALTHPLTLFLSVWLFCLLLYAMHLSGLLIFRLADVEWLVAWIILPFAGAIVALDILYLVAPKTRSHFRRVDIHDDAYLVRVEKKIDFWFKCWIVLTVIEVVFSGGVPIFWLILGSSRAYNEFGLPVIHVFATSLLSVIALAKFGIFLLRGERRRLRIPIFLLIWAVLIVSRGLMITALAQWVILWFCLKGTSIKTLIRTVVIVCLVVLLFGYIGDARSGGLSELRSLARPTSNYPTWLPSGVLWFYIYITSPLNNLANASLNIKPSYDIFFPRTTYFMFPTPLRNAIYGKNANLFSGDYLVVPALKASSAYIGPFLDDGFFGIACFSVLLGCLSGYFWKKRKVFRDQLLYALIGQCILLSIFFNFLFYNPFLGQVFWVYLFFSQRDIGIFRTTSPGFLDA